MQTCYLTIFFLASIRELMETAVFYFNGGYSFLLCSMLVIGNVFLCELTLDMIVYFSILSTLLLSLLAVLHLILSLAHITFAISVSHLEEMVLQIQVGHKPNSRQIIHFSWSLVCFWVQLESQMCHLQYSRVHPTLDPLEDLLQDLCPEHLIICLSLGLIAEPFCCYF